MGADAEIMTKVQYFEAVTARWLSLSGAERAQVGKDMIAFYDSLDPSKNMYKYAAVGLGAAAILPGIGWLAGTLIGGAYGALKDSTVETQARDRLKRLIDQFGAGG